MITNINQLNPEIDPLRSLQECPKNFTFTPFEEGAQPHGLDQHDALFGAVAVVYSAKSTEAESKLIGLSTSKNFSGTHSEAAEALIEARAQLKDQVKSDKLEPALDRFKEGALESGKPGLGSNDYSYMIGGIAVYRSLEDDTDGSVYTAGLFVSNNFNRGVRWEAERVLLDYSYRWGAKCPPELRAQAKTFADQNNDLKPESVDPIIRTIISDELPEEAFLRTASGLEVVQIPAEAPGVLASQEQPVLQLVSAA